MHRLVQELLSVEKWQPDCEMLQCAADDYSTLLRCTKVTDGAVSVEIAASSMRPLGARVVICNVPLDISTDDLVACLARQRVIFVKTFSFQK